MSIFKSLGLALGAATAIFAFGALSASALEGNVKGTIEGTVSYNLAGGSVSAQVNGHANQIGGYGYVAWLVNETSGAKLNLGVVSDDGDFSYSGNDHSNGGYSAFVLTYETITNTTNEPLGPPVARADAAATGSRPLASLVTGTAKITDTTLAASVEGLAPLPSGYEYVGWLVDAAEAKTNVGVLSEEGANSFNGSALLSKGFQNYVVTYEPLGNTTSEPQGMPVAVAMLAAPSAPASGSAGLNAAEEGNGSGLNMLIVAGLLSVVAGAAAFGLSRKRDAMPS